MKDPEIRFISFRDPVDFGQGSVSSFSTAKNAGFTVTEEGMYFVFESKRPGGGVRRRRVPVTNVLCIDEDILEAPERPRAA